MTLIEKLINEHQLILRYIDLIHLLVRLTDKNLRDQLVRSHGDEIIEFVQLYVDNYHHRKEEDILFTYMNKAETSLHCNPIPQMLNEHNAARECVRNMIEAMDGMNNDLFCESAVAYSILLQEHIMKEDRVLYPMAIQGITPYHKEKIHKEYEEIENCFKEKKNYDQFYEKKLGFLKNQII